MIVSDDDVNQKSGTICLNTYHYDCLKKVAKKELIENYKLVVLKDDFCGNNYLGELIRIRVDGIGANGKPISLNLFLKMAHSSSQVRGGVDIRKYYMREIYSYTVILPELEKFQNSYNYFESKRFNFLKFYDSFDEEPNEFIVMEDLNVKGFEMSKREKPFDLDHIRLVIENLAYFHGLSLALKTHKPELYNKIASTIAKHEKYSKNIETYVKSFIKNALVYIKDNEKRTKFQSIANYEQALRCAQPGLCEPFNVFCHGDLWKNNILFKYENEKPVDLRLVDWQWVKYCSPVVDLSHLIFSSTEKSLRDEHYRNLLDLYHDALRITLKRFDCDVDICYPRRILEEQLRTVLPYGLVFSIGALTFSLRESNDVVDLETSVKVAAENDEFNYEFTNPESAANFEQHLEGIIDDYIKFGII